MPNIMQRIDVEEQADKIITANAGIPDEIPPEAATIAIEENASQDEIAALSQEEWNRLEENVREELAREISNRGVDPEECDHENRTYDGTDTDAAPEVIYREYWCEDCGSFVSEVYKHEGYRIVQNDGDAWEEGVE